ncbi:ubiquitin carboxyl-terminal hydrolase CYLD [Salarias fasciatus]|uniref:ubiquitinyl hydrolase 1 n=1 Tax=Salarias fasciatus TaxID=181472 RepID=A0A672FYR5_SALFA|nr:ubiquitin carboxyl-terminal hydrolase CYLD-like [Salarias fasciatus]
MSGANEHNRKRRPHRMYLISTDLRVQDELEGTIRLVRGYLCQELDSRGDHPWVKVLDSSIMCRVEKRYLLEISNDVADLLEPVRDPEARLKLLNNGTLQQLPSLPLNAPLWVQMGEQGELAEAELKYVGPLTGGSSAVYFGVELMGSAVGRGQSNGSYKGHRLFHCPEACGLFVPASHITPRQWSRGNASDGQERARGRDHHRASSGPQSNGHHGNIDRPSHHPHHPPQQQHSRRISFHQHHRPSSPTPTHGLLSRTTESASASAHGRGPALSPPLFQTGQRVCFQVKDAVHAGEVQFCGVLSGRSSPGTYVGVVADAPVGNWDGFYKGVRLCHIPSPLYGLLLPVGKVSSEQKSHRHNPLFLPTPKSILKPTLPPLPKPAPTSPTASSPKTALMPPVRHGPKPPPPPPPKPNLKLLPPPPLPPPPVPPPKPQSSALPPAAEPPPQHANGTHSPPSALWSPHNGDEAAVDGEAGPGEELEVGSMVEVNDPPLFGVIRWIGQINGVPETVAGIELDHELSAGTDGSYLGERHFRCPPNKGLFVKLRNCRRDSRFPAPETPVNQVERCNSICFADWGSERVEEHTPPVEGDEARELYDGWKRGIQGHLNSCYLDATLFSLFSCCSSADWVLFWPADTETEQSSSQAQDLLRCEIVNPLRRYGYVCASKTMALRRLLEAANTNAGFTNQEKDPEEFLNKLFQLLRVEPLLKIRSMTQEPQECHLYQLFPPALPSSPSSPSPVSPVGSPIPLSLPASGRMRVATVQSLLEASFLHSGLKFVEAPSCLLLLMPRFGKEFKMFDAILPSLSLDITDLLDDSLRQCSICQAVAEWECLQCYEDRDITPGHLKQYCETCKTQVHTHKKRASHSPVKISVPDPAWTGPLHCARQQMSLFAVTCIETSHYVSFVKHGPLASDWLFFDSMADREGGENGFNIPHVKACPEVGRYLSLSEDELSRVDAASLRESTRRLLCDSYMCLYHSPELSLYK